MAQTASPPSLRTQIRRRTSLSVLPEEWVGQRVRARRTVPQPSGRIVEAGTEGLVYALGNRKLLLDPEQPLVTGLMRVPRRFLPIGDAEALPHPSLASAEAEGWLSAVVANALAMQESRSRGGWTEARRLVEVERERSVQLLLRYRDGVCAFCGGEAIRCLPRHAAADPCAPR